MSLPPGVRAVVIDLYGTLVHVPPPPKEEQLTTRLGVAPATLFRALEMTGPSRWAGTYGSAEGDMAATIQACGLERSEEFIRELTARHIAGWAGTTCFFEDSGPVLAELRARGLKTAVLSNCDHRTRPAATLALADKVDAVICSVDVGSAKPAARVYEIVLERLGVNAAEAVFVDDHVEYCAGAQSVGLYAYLIQRDGRGVTPPPGADAIIPDLRALL